MTLLILPYSFFIIWVLYGILKKQPQTNNKQTNFNCISIVVVFRNESKNLSNLLNSFLALEYPTEHFEIILVDDDSSDNSSEIIQSYLHKFPNIQLLTNQRISISPKKDGIATAIHQSKGTWIAVTDADCIVPTNWLGQLNQCINTNQPLLVAGPVICTSEYKLLKQYQQLEFLALMGITMGTMNLSKPIMCNGANLAYHKKTFLQTVNFNTKQTVSGDDIDILESFYKKFPNRIMFNQKSIVTTNALENWKDLIQQKIRWAAKSSQYKNIFTQLVALIVLTTQITITFFLFYNVKVGLELLLTKLCVDFILIYYTSKKLQQTVSIYYFLMCSILYPFINSYIGLKSIIGNYEWKERKFYR